MAEHGGAVLNIASIGGLAVEGGIGWYNVTKAAVIHLTSQLAGELGPEVRVNAIAPGLVKTDLARALWETGRGADRPPPADRGGWACPTTSPTPPCSSARTRRRGSPATPWWSTAAPSAWPAAHCPDQGVAG